MLPFLPCSMSVAGTCERTAAASAVRQRACAAACAGARPDLLALHRQHVCALAAPVVHGLQACRVAGCPGGHPGRWLSLRDRQQEPEHQHWYACAQLLQLQGPTFSSTCRAGALGRRPLWQAPAGEAGSALRPSLMPLAQGRAGLQTLRSSQPSHKRWSIAMVGSGSAQCRLCRARPARAQIAACPRRAPARRRAGQAAAASVVREQVAVRSAPQCPHTLCLPQAQGALAAVQSTGVEFQEVQSLWQGAKFRSLGAGVRVKKLGGFIPVKARAPPACARPRGWPPALPLSVNLRNADAFLMPPQTRALRRCMPCPCTWRRPRRCRSWASGPAAASSAARTTTRRP